jgi:hypothetical protein
VRYFYQSHTLKSSSAPSSNVASYKKHSKLLKITQVFIESVLKAKSFECSELSAI